MHVNLKRALLLCVTLFVSQLAWSEDTISVIGGAAYVVKRSDFTVGDAPFNPEFISIDWSVVVAYRSFYTRINIDQSIRGDTIIDNRQNSFDGVIEHSLVSLERDDAAITFGFSMLDSISIFTGYKYGETSGLAGGQLREFNTFPGPPDLLITYTDVSFESTGPFLGVSYTYYLRKSGSINFSVAYADLDGEARLTSVEIDDAGERFIDAILLEGENTGLSYTLGWTDVFSEDMNYTVSLNIIRYTFDAPLAPNGDDFDFDENFTNLSISFTKFF